MTITACNYGSHAFQRQHLDKWAHRGYHLHVCVECGASYLANCRSCVYPEASA